MMKRRIGLLALPLLSITACLDMSDQDAMDDTSSQAEIGIQITRICETFGDHRCVGAPDLAFTKPIVETDVGRNFQISPVAGGVKLAFTGPSRCVALQNGTNLVTIRACDVDSATWKMVRGENGCMFQQGNRFLSGPNNGGQFTVMTRPAPTPGWLQQFDLPNAICP